MGNLYGSSNHPVEIKKIRLAVWEMREELEAIVKEGLSGLDGKESELSPLIEELKTKYSHPFPEKGAEQEGEAQEGKDEESEKSDEEKSEQEEEESEAKTSEEGEEGADDASKDENEDQENSEKGPENLVEFYFHRPQDLDPMKGEGVCLLSDITVMDVCFFSSRPFLAGQTIMIDFLVPKHFNMTAEVLDCKNYNFKSRVISPTRPPYRIHAKFSFLREGEISLLRNFVASIEPNIPESTTAAPKVESEDSDDFDDLDDLGL